MRYALSSVFRFENYTNFMYIRIRNSMCSRLRVNVILSRALTLREDTSRRSFLRRRMFAEIWKTVERVLSPGSPDNDGSARLSDSSGTFTETSSVKNVTFESFLTAAAHKNRVTDLTGLFPNCALRVYGIEELPRGPCPPYPGRGGESWTVSPQPPPAEAHMLDDLRDYTKAVRRHQFPSLFTRAVPVAFRNQFPGDLEEASSPKSPFSFPGISVAIRDIC